MKQYCYAIVDSQGYSRTLAESYEHGMDEERDYELPQLLRDGWRPVREIPMGTETDVERDMDGANVDTRSYVLILLEREEDGEAAGS